MMLAKTLIYAQIVSNKDGLVLQSSFLYGRIHQKPDEYAQTCASVTAQLSRSCVAAVTCERGRRLWL